MSMAGSGAQSLLRALTSEGVRICFANPGTTELAVVRALEAVPSMRSVLGLFEGVCTGAADGYARVSGSAAATLLHLGPGFANGLANLHNARRAHSPIVNIIGDHATWHLRYDAPLTSDIESFARPVSGHIVTLDKSRSIYEQTADAVRAAYGPPGRIVTVIAPNDLMEANDGATEAPGSARPARPTAAGVPPERIERVASQLSRCEQSILLLGHDALSERGQRAAARVAKATGARLLMESYPAIVELGGDLPALERLAYFPQDVLSQLGNATVLLAGARAPISYFGYEGQPSELVSAERLLNLSQPGEDSVAALEQLAELTSSLARSAGEVPRSPMSAAPLSGPLSPVHIAEELVRQLPVNAIISLEGSTCGGPYLKIAHQAARHALMTNTGGAIGQGIPCAVGAAFARPDSRIVCLQSDGSAMYTLQALWTLARENLNVTVIIAANHRYGILQTELKRAGADLNTPVLSSLTSLSPRIDWVSLASGLGVRGFRADTAEEFRAALSRCLSRSGPTLIQAELP